MRTVDIVIVGAGPAGLCAAQYAARAGLRALALEGAAIGGEALNIGRLENYPGSADTSGAALTAAMRAQAEAFGAEFVMGKADGLSDCPPDALPGGAGGFTVSWTDAEGRKDAASARALIFATGARHKPLGVPGEEKLIGMGVSYCAACDGPFFKDKRIIVVGGGDAACDGAIALARVSPHVTLVHRRGFFSAQKAVSDRMLRDGNIAVRLNTRVIEIRGETRVKAVLLEDAETGRQAEETADAVFIFAGVSPRSELAAQNELRRKPALSHAGFIVTGMDMCTTVLGIFAAGDVRSSPFRQVVTAAGDGAVAAHSAAEYITALGTPIGSPPLNAVSAGRD